jgi:hypothetical protein
MFYIKTLLKQIILKQSILKQTISMNTLYIESENVIFRNVSDFQRKIGNLSIYMFIYLNISI